MGTFDIILIVFGIAVAIMAGLYFLNKWATRRLNEQQGLIDRSKQSVSIFVIDKGRLKAKDSNLPKAVSAQLPKYYRFMKLNLVKAKVGPSIVTLMCDRNIYDAIQLKKTIKVELAGIYIVSFQGQKSKAQLIAEGKVPKGFFGRVWSRAKGLVVRQK